MPPSTRKVDAVMNDESSEARNAAAAAISEASPKRPIGMCTSRRAARSGSLAKSSCEQRRVDRSRAERVHPHALAGELHAELARQGEHAALGSRVADLAGRRAHDGDERRRVDDRAPAAGQQVRQRVLAAQVDRREVDPLHTLPRLEPGLEDGVVVGRADAGVVATDVDAAEVGGHLAVQRLHLVGGRDVGPDEHAADRCRHLAAGLSSRSTTATLAPSAAKRSHMARPMPLAPPVTTATRSTRRWA